MSTTGTLVSYAVSGTVRDARQLHNFLLDYLGSARIRFDSVNVDVNTNTITVNTKESALSAATQSLVNDLVVNKYPDPPFDPVPDISNFTIRCYHESISIWIFFIRYLSIMM